MKQISSHLVGIGASAGGLVAIKALVSQIQPASIPITYVICQHLAPDKRSYMKDILTDIVKIPLKIIESGAIIEGDTIYLSPPGSQVAVIKGYFVLTELPADHAPTRSIDFFFRAIAIEYKTRGFGVILSGSGNDGLKGCQDIYEAGGEVFVQDPLEAEFPSMPEAVINSGFYSKSLEAHIIFNEIKASLRENSNDFLSNKLFDEVHANIDGIARVISDEFGINVRDYKFATVCRRTAKRMQGLKLESAKNYIELLITDPKERLAFLNEILISVTTFFRDADFFESLRIMLETIDPEPGIEYRIWSAGCSHGEEAYSLLMTVVEIFDRRGLKNPIKLFATDVNAQNLDVAARGFYLESSLENVPMDFRLKYFDRVNAGYIIKRYYREMIIFSRHDLLQSPPFSGIDLAVCRNLLIYLNPTAQSRSLLNLVFSIRINGVLALGPSETMGFLQQYFTPIDKKWRLFKKLRNTDGTLSSQWRAPRMNNLNANSMAQLKSERLALKGNPIHDVFVSLYPDSILIDDQLELCAVFGQGHLLLNQRTDGVLTNRIDTLVHESVLLSLRVGISEAKASSKTICFENIILYSEGQEPSAIAISISCMPGPAQKNYYLCLVGRSPAPPQDMIKRSLVSSDDVAYSLKVELDQTKIALQEAVTELELTNEELQTSNEELIASNEELQSTNEELSSVNEELYTLNGELQQKIDLISTMNDDLSNLINSTRVGVIFLDKKSIIRRITPVVEDSFYIRNSDIGRNIFELDFSTHLQPVKEQLENGEIVSAKFEIQSKTAESYLCAVVPYYNDLSQHQGCVISLVNITESIVREHLLNETQSEAKIGGWILDLRTQSSTWTKQIYDIYETSANTIPKSGIGMAYYSQKDRIILERCIDRCASLGQPFEGTYSCTTALGRVIWVRISGRPVRDQLGKVFQIRGTVQDISESRFMSERMDLALAMAKIGIWDLNLQSEALFWNKQQQEIYGIEKQDEQFTYTDWQKSVYPEDLAQTEAALQESIKSGVIFDRTWRILRNGEIRYIHGSAKVYHDYVGKPVRVIGVNRDITEVTLAEIQLEEQRQQSFQNSKLASIGELAAGVGHEINNPLAILMGNNKILKKILGNRSQLSNDIEQIFGQQESAAIRIRDIVSGLRIFARHESVVKPCLLSELVNNLLSLIKQKFPQK